MKKWLTTIIVLGLIFLGLGLNNSHQVEATAYGRKLYTVPREMRGDWHYRSHHNVPIYGIPSRDKRVYRRISLTAHGIAFFPRGRIGLRGHYSLVKVPTRSWTAKQINKAEKYAARHHWLGVSANNGHNFSFSTAWLHTYESNVSGELNMHKGHLIFANEFTKDYYKK